MTWVVASNLLVAHNEGYDTQQFGASVALTLYPVIDDTLSISGSREVGAVILLRIMAVENGGYTSRH